MKTKFDYGTCIFCGGDVEEKIVESICHRKGRLLGVIEGVPTGVCDQCGERYYRPDVTKRLEHITAHINKAKQSVNIPTMKYAA